MNAVGSSVGTADCKDSTYLLSMSQCSGAPPTKFGGLLAFPFGYAIFVAIWIDLWCSLKSTIGCVGSKPTWLGFWFRLMSKIVYTQPWGFLFGDTMLFAICGHIHRPGCVREGPCFFLQGLASCSPELGADQ